jgi:hypothetical protein
MEGMRRVIQKIMLLTVKNLIIQNGILICFDICEIPTDCA